MVTATETQLRQPEFLEHLKAQGINISARMLRHYAGMGLIPRPPKVQGEGNVCFYPADLVERIRLIQYLVSQGESLQSIAEILSSTKGSEKEVMDFLSTKPVVELRARAIELLKQGKTLNGISKDTVIQAKEKYLKEFQKHYSPEMYRKLTDNFFSMLSKYKRFFPEDWTKDKILDYFGFKPNAIDFEDRIAVRRFKRDFFQKLGKFLKERKEILNRELERDIELCDENVQSYNRFIKDLESRS